jgi:hypothetical protein
MQYMGTSAVNRGEYYGSKQESNGLYLYLNTIGFVCCNMLKL